MHRFYVGETAFEGLGAGDDLPLSRELQRRLTNVLRMRGGERVGLFGGGRELEADLVRDGRQLRALLLRECPGQVSRRSVTLYQALIRPNRFEWLLEKATELGVDCVTPIISEHTSHKPADVSAERFARWTRIAVEASEQCGRRTIPSLTQPAAFADVLQSSAGARVLAWEGLRTSGPEDTSDVIAAATRFSLFIGPEGGWAAGEVDQARAMGCCLLHLGPTILRAETAAIAAIALLMLNSGGPMVR